VVSSVYGIQAKKEQEIISYIARHGIQNNGHSKASMLYSENSG